MAALAAAGVDVAGQQGYHLLWYASQQGVTCITPHVGKEQTFALLDDWAPKPNRPSRPEALAIIAERYFRSHGPATAADLARWTGLTMTDVRAGIAAAGDRLTTADVDGVPMILDPALLDAGLGPVDDWAALPGFDEFMLGYKDRSMMLDDEHKDAIIPGGNGVFQSTIVHAGRVAGVWKRTLGKTAVSVTVTPLVPFTAADRRHATEALEPYATFVGLPLKVTFP